VILVTTKLQLDVNKLAGMKRRQATPKGWLINHFLP